MSDRELLELAAKAAGVVILDGMQHDVSRIHLHTSVGAWNPLKDDGDALRLAVKLALMVSINLGESRTQNYEAVERRWLTYKEPHGNSPDAATRRAIVRAAAAIGERIDAPLVRAD